MNIIQTKKLNSLITENPSALVEQGEQSYHDSIASTALKVAAECKQKPIILLSGPSGSAKTTTAMRIAALLNTMGHKTHVISMDNYFLPLDDPRNDIDENGVIDLESPKRMDLELLSEDLEKFWECKPVQLPQFDFALQKRTCGETLTRAEDELIIFEGIHALNPEVTGKIQAHSNGIYVSVRTRIGLDSRLLHPSKIRLMRRLMRDNLFRGRELTSIIRAFHSVERGERLYIMPYKELAAFDIDTFMSFEASVYKHFLLPQLKQIPSDYEFYGMVSELILFFENLDEVSAELVPPHSIVREFVGGSGFTY